MPDTDPLHHYRRKRNFAVTTEPQDPKSRRADRPDATGRVFVVQKHAARSLHYDFRLELDGSLKSWAVPKGPSLDPTIRRMAIHVEDHPLEYADFEGTIPPKQYGAGRIIVWDRGTWTAEGDPLTAYRTGKLEFELHGHKLTGRWVLVRMHGHEGERQEPWLLIKERDAAARAEGDFDVVEALPDSVLGSDPENHGPPPQARVAELPQQLAPQLATLVASAPEGPGWIWEMKFDGYRILARIDARKVRLFTRNGHDWTRRLPSLVRAVAELELPSGWLDGEIVVQGPHGAPDFQRLQNAFEISRTEQILYYVFDMPYCAGYDLRQVPLHRRRALLREWLEAHPSRRVRFSEDFEAAPRTLLRSACELRMEGLIGKRSDSTYVSRRSTDWIKLKCTERQEFVIGGYTDPKGSRKALGSLLLGLHDEGGALRYAGRVGSGFDSRQLGELADRLHERETGESPFTETVRERGARWVRPELVAEVSFTQWTADGRIRHGVFHGLRSDKPPAEVSREVAVPAQSARANTAARPRELAGVRVSNAERVIDASTGITKLELVRHYANVAPRMLPQLRNRPVALLRAPDGLDGARFFQKHASRSAIPGVRSLDRRYDPGEEPLMAIGSAKALVTVAQMNAFEIHTWNATTAAIEKPDRMVFDLDPGEGVDWTAMREAARLVHALLDDLDLSSFLKTSGSKGLHIVVPLVPEHGWDVVKAFSKAIVVHLARTLPDRFVARSGPANRKGRIYPDFLRNARGATTVAVWSARARPGMGVSTPVDWNELPGITAANQWTLRNIESRLDAPDPWAGYASRSQRLDAAMRALDFVPAKAA